LKHKFGNSSDAIIPKKRGEMVTAKEVLVQWLDAVNCGDVSKLLTLYDRQAILIPTFSNKMLDSPEKLCDYFERLGGRAGLSIALHEKTILERNISDTLCTISGIYNWRFEVEDEMLNFEARFSYVLDLTRESPILHHHSSQIPRML
jgi:hypothetical protein